ncbi:hypothetical protein N7456_007743 [Penicillium angulare]|uniref:14-3-3 domain-containing protein n=1 Tax=Penicillium angulare TaxID=116970 RepID=A0A9W9K9K1_9EURO|nr:hypothetical protein N7456_007743 [Penicillium angulare]
MHITDSTYDDLMTDLLNQEVAASASLALWMASSEVDQKALGNFAAAMALENPLLSTMLYKVLGLSVMLSKKLLRARRLRRLDPTRETKSLHLYHHIIWLSREGLFLLEGYILPLVAPYVELKVLSYKLRASFYHIFVLFHNRPIIQAQDTNPPPNLKHESIYGANSLTTLRNMDPQSKTGHPPGLAPVQLQPVQPISSFLLPPLDYTTTATACFNHASSLADQLLPGSHPLRLSVKLEYAAYLYDCLQDPVSCRRLAKRAIADVYNAQEGMDDESFEDAAEIVGVLGKMVKRGGKPGSSTAASSFSRGDRSHTGSQSRSSPSHLDTSIPTTASPIPVTKTTPNTSSVAVQPAVPNVTMMNPI